MNLNSHLGACALLASLGCEKLLGHDVITLKRLSTSKLIDNPLLNLPFFEKYGFRKASGVGISHQTFSVRLITGNFVHLEESILLEN